MANIIDSVYDGTSLVQSEPQKHIVHAILKKERAQSDSTNTRMDSFGQPILKGSKQHRIKFREENEVYQVESYKIYNVDVTQQEPPCVCVIS